MDKDFLHFLPNFCHSGWFFKFWVFAVHSTLKDDKNVAKNEENLIQKLKKELYTLSSYGSVNSADEFSLSSLNWYNDINS